MTAGCGECKKPFAEQERRAERITWGEGTDHVCHACFLKHIGWKETGNDAGVLRMKCEHDGNGVSCWDPMTREAAAALAEGGFGPGRVVQYEAPRSRTYTVSVNGASACQHVANQCVVMDNGTLVLWMESEIIAAYAPGVWRDVESDAI